MPEIINVSAIIPTRNRATAFGQTLQSLAAQSSLPKEIIVIDASENEETAKALSSIHFPSEVSIVYAKAVTRGAAAQRIQGIELVTSDFVLFMDDDIFFEEHCIARLLGGFSQGERVGGVSSMITNQLYTKPGTASRTMYRIMTGGQRPTWAGMIIGPAWNLLPEDDPTLPDYVKCEWLNSTCTMYRKTALPNPLFPEVFQGYSMFEDVTLSVTIGRTWTLLNARTARIFHDSQPGDHKDRVIPLSEMEVVNRHYVMTKVLGRKKLGDYGKLFAYEMFMIASGFMSVPRLRNLPRVVVGKLKGYFKILFS
jgi:glycosyltransferase involved in cell wall biosynthesis